MTVGVDGAMLSYVILNCVAAVLLFDAVSWAALPAMSTVTVPCPVGVRSKVYVVPEPETVPAVPFPTTTSLESNPVTDSLKVAVIGIGEVFVGEVAVEVRVTVGATPSLATAATPSATSFAAASTVVPAVAPYVTVGVAEVPVNPEVVRVIVLVVPAGSVFAVTVPADNV